MSGLDSEEWMMMHQIVTHYAHQLQTERDRVADLQRRLDAALARQELLEGLAYGASFL